MHNNSNNNNYRNRKDSANFAGHVIQIFTCYQGPSKVGTNRYPDWK